MKRCAQDPAFTTSILDPYGLREYDVSGFYDSLASENRTGLADLERTVSQGLKDNAGAALTAADTKVMILIHGWNPDRVSDPLSSGGWGSMKTHLTTGGKLSSEWTLVPYTWAEDASTGNIWEPLGDASPLEAREESVSQTEDGLFQVDFLAARPFANQADISPDGSPQRQAVFGSLNATQAAERCVSAWLGDCKTVAHSGWR